MAEKIVGNAELLLSPEEIELFDRQSAAQASADTDKTDAEYQNEPNENGERCSGCDMFVPGFSTDVSGYCSKVKSFNGPLGMIFPDGWCKFFSNEDAAFFLESQGDAVDDQQE